MFVTKHLMAGVSRLGWERGLAVETGKAQRQENAQITRYVPQIGCTRDWALFHILLTSLQ